MTSPRPILEGTVAPERAFAALQPVRDNHDIASAFAISSLVYLEPDEIRPADFDKFMPPGMSAYRRPTS